MVPLIKIENFEKKIFLGISLGIVWFDSVGDQV